MLFSLPRQVQLDVSYRAKIDAGAVVLCTAEVESLEGRKLWMKVRRPGACGACVCSLQGTPRSSL